MKKSFKKTHAYSEKRSRSKKEAKLERRVRKKIFFEFEQRSKDNIAYELQSKNDIESYDKVMESYQNYPVVIYTYILKYKQMLKNFVSTKMKSLRNIINILMIFIILL